jgi:hypothetical protein
MNYKQLTAPCGRDCFNCPLFCAKDDENLENYFIKKYNMEKGKVGCDGCRTIDGKCYFLQKLGFSEQCKIFKCVSGKKLEFCYECNVFPCDLLQPLADRAGSVPHNLKVYNLCLIKRMGVENWAKNKAKETFDRYFKSKLDL